LKRRAPKRAIAGRAPPDPDVVTDRQRCFAATSDDHLEQRHGEADISLAMT
jgi:hypothetical protein